MNIIKRLLAPCPTCQTQEQAVLARLDENRSLLLEIRAIITPTWVHRPAFSVQALAKDITRDPE